MRFTVAAVGFALLFAVLFCPPLAFCQNSKSDWDKVIEAGRREGKVVASIPPTPELRKLMEITFARRYGIATEFVPARGSAIIQRMVSEAKTGTNYFDLHIGGTESIVTGLLPEDVLEPIDPFLMLPEVRDPKQWWGGHLYMDNAKRFIYNFVAYQTVSLWSNSNLYRPSQFHSFDDLLQPKLQGKIGISDPRTPGSGSSMWSYMHYIKGEDYLRRLAAQKLFITRDLRLLAESLARGKIAVTSGIGYSEFQPFIKANLPVVSLPVPKEGLYISGGYGHLTILKNLPHPNATKVFVNWLLSRDGQEVFGRGMGVGTRRLEINTQWLKDYGVIAAKDFLAPTDFYKFENQSEEKIKKIREPAAVFARKILGS